MANPVRKYGYYLGSIFTLLAGMRQFPRLVGIFLGLSRPGQVPIRLRRGDVRLKVRGPMDIWSVKETFLDRFYERYGVPVEPGWNVVDIGGGIGEFTLFAALVHPSTQVYAFEPFPESLALLQENVRLNAVQNVQAFPEAIAGKTGRLVLDLTESEPLKLQSRAATAGNAGAAGQRLEVPCLTLGEALDRLGLALCDLLKLDCEGAEYDILMNTAPQTLERIERIVMEYHDQPTPYTHRDLEQFLASAGYRVRSVVNVVHDDLGYLYAERSRAG